MLKPDYLLFVFDSTSDAMSANQLLGGLGAIVMPTLREISASCGISLRLDAAHRAEAAALLEGGGIRLWRLYHVESHGKAHLCTLLQSAADV